MVRVSAAARYHQIKQIILDRIANGSLKAGARVPSENELVRELEVSRMTANRALRELAAEGLLVRIAGVGTFVAERRVHSHPLAVRSIAEEIHERGHRHTMRLVGKGSVKATPELAERCGVATGARLDHSLIVHCEDAVPLQVEDRYVNPLVIRGYLHNDFARVTPHDFLMDAAPLQRAEHTVRAVPAAPGIRRLLKLAPHEPCLLILRRTWARGGIATYAELHYPGSRYELTGGFHQRPPQP